MFWGVLEIKDPATGQGSGRFRMVGRSDDDAGYTEMGCGCPGGHVSREAAEQCPEYYRRNIQPWEVPLTKCPNCGHEFKT